MKDNAQTGAHTVAHEQAASCDVHGGRRIKKKKKSATRTAQDSKREEKKCRTHTIEFFILAVHCGHAASATKKSRCWSKRLVIELEL